MASNPTSKELKRVKKTLSEIEKNIKKTVAQEKKEKADLIRYQKERERRLAKTKKVYRSSQNVAQRNRGTRKKRPSPPPPRKPYVMEQGTVAKYLDSNASLQNVHERLDRHANRVMQIRNRIMQQDHISDAETKEMEKLGNLVTENAQKVTELATLLESPLGTIKEIYPGPMDPYRLRENYVGAYDVPSGFIDSSPISEGEFDGTNSPNYMQDMPQTEFPQQRGRVRANSSPVFADSRGIYNQEQVDDAMRDSEEIMTRLIGDMEVEDDGREHKSADVGEMLGRNTALTAQDEDEVAEELEEIMREQWGEDYDAGRNKKHKTRKSHKKKSHGTKKRHGKKRHGTKKRKRKPRRKINRKGKKKRGTKRKRKGRR